MKQKPQTSGFPRVECCVDGCTRGTTRIQPDNDGNQGEWICAHHWRMVPKVEKKRLSFWFRKWKSAYERGDGVADRRCSRNYWTRWAIIKGYLNGDSSTEINGMPLQMANELKRLGLI